MNKDMLLIEKKGYVATLILNRPEKRNALYPELLREIRKTFQAFSRTDDIRTVVIRGEGDTAFSSGYDIGAIPTQENPEEIWKDLKNNPIELAFEGIESYPYPTIAMLNGYAFGAGCELAIACDIRIAADNIRMGIPPAKLGVVYPPSGFLRFVRILGFSTTKELFFTGRSYDGPMLKELGLVDYLVPRADLEFFTYNLAEEMAGNAPFSLKSTKRVLNLLMRKTQFGAKDYKVAESFMEQAFRSEDLREGQLAFLEKRKPIFTGK